jgi:hypothetical protein
MPPVVPPVAPVPPGIEGSSLTPRGVRSAARPAPKFFGAHGFSNGDVAEGSSVAIDLTITKAAHLEQPSLQKEVTSELEQLKKLVR